MVTWVETSTLEAKDVLIEVTIMQWTNQKTGDIEELESIPDDRWPEFIPQDETCQMLYQRLLITKVWFLKMRRLSLWLDQ